MGDNNKKMTLLILKKILTFFLKYYDYIFISLLCFSICFYFYSVKIDAINKQQQIELLQKENKIKEQAIELNKELDETKKKLKEIEDEKRKELDKLQKQNNDLLVSVANGTKRLHIITQRTNSCKTGNSTSSSMDDATSCTGIIDTKTAEALVRITNDGDTYKKQLESLQAWVKRLSKLEK